MAYGYRSLNGGTARRILTRDGHRCYICGGQASQVDHVIPVSQGGTHDVANLAAICLDCHTKKSTAERLAGQQRRSATRKTTLRARDEPHPGTLGI